MVSFFFGGQSGAFVSGQRIMNPIETYVQAVTAQVHFFLDRGRIGDELRAHLQDSAEDLMQEEGLTPEQAQAEAAARMGDPQAVGRELNRIHHPLLGWLWLITMSCAAIAGIVLVYLLLTVGWNEIQYLLPMTPKQAEKIAVVNEKVELAGHTVTLDALWKSDEGNLILTYHIRNKLSYSRSGWSVDFFSIQNGDDSLPVYPYFEATSFLGSKGMLTFTAPASGVIELSLIDGQRVTLDLKQWELKK